MARIIVDDTAAQVAQQPDQRFWKLAGGSGYGPTQNAGGWWEWPGNTGGQNRVMLSKLKPFTPQGILVRVRRDVASGSTRLRIWTSHSGALAGTGLETATSGHSLTIASDGTSSVQQLVASSSTTVSSGVSGTKVPVGSWVWVRFERMAGRIRARLWTDGTTEPTAWDHDVADDGAVPAGVPAIGMFMSGGTMRFIASKATIYAADGSIPSQSRPQVHTKMDGTRMAFGRRSQTRTDDVSTDALPSWLSLTSGTASADSPTGVRTLTAAGSSTAKLTGVPAAAVCHVLTVDNFRLSDDATNLVAVALAFTDGTTTWELRQDATGISRLTVGGVATEIPYQLRGNGEGPRHRTLSLMLAPIIRQLIAWEGDWRTGQIIGWVDLTSLPAHTTPLTPSVAVTATTSTAKSLGYTNLTVEVQRL